MAHPTTFQAASEDAALPGLREQILANAKHLFPEIIKDFRAEHGIGMPVYASDVFDIVTLTDHAAMFYLGGGPGSAGMRASLTYGASDDSTAKTALIGATTLGRSGALRSLLAITEELLETNARALFQTEEGALGALIGTNGVFKGKVDGGLVASNVEHARGLRNAGAIQN